MTQEEFSPHPPLTRLWACVTRRDQVVLEYTRSSVKTKSKLINLMNNSQIEGYNDK